VCISFDSRAGAVCVTFHLLSGSGNLIILNYLGAATVLEEVSCNVMIELRRTILLL